MATKSELLEAKAAKYAMLARQERQREKVLERKKRNHRLIQLGGTVESVLKQTEVDIFQADIGLLAGLILEYKELFVMTVDERLGADALQLKASGDAYLQERAAMKPKKQAENTPLLDELGEQENDDDTNA